MRRASASNRSSTKPTACCGRSTIKSTVSGGLAAGTVARVTFTDLLANGQAVGRIDGVVVFVWGPLPGETASVRVSLVKAKYAVAEVIEREDESPLRADPFCPVFGECGGCQVQHLAYPAQLAWKEQIVRSALQRIGGIAGVQVAHPIGMTDPRAYRNKMALVVENSGPTPVLGFYQARSHDIVPISACPVVLPQLNEGIKALREVAIAPATAAALKPVKHAIMRAGAASKQAVLSLTTERAAFQIAAVAPAIAGRMTRLVGVSNSFEPRNANAVMGRKINHVWGRKEMEESIEDVRFRVSSSSFFQVNSEMVGKIFRFMAPGLKQPRKIVDLYCGAGTFAIYFAAHGASVVGIEENEAAVREARANAELNRVGGRTRFIAGRVEGAVANADGLQALRDAEIVFLDPPRKGSDALTLDALAEADVPNIWYLSCNPATLARDLQRLIGHGYAVGVVQPFDMFPQTGHVETLVTLAKIGREAVVLPPREKAEWDDRIPVWPSQGRTSAEGMEFDSE